MIKEIFSNLRSIQKLHANRSLTNINWFMTHLISRENHSFDVNFFLSIVWLKRNVKSSETIIDFYLLRDNPKIVLASIGHRKKPLKSLYVTMWHIYQSIKTVGAQECELF